MMLAMRHEEYSNYSNLPFILHIDLERTCYKNSKEKNWHKDIEIQLCTKGNGTVLINGENYDFRENDIAVINSDLIHHTGTEKNIIYTCLIISAEFCSRIGINCNELIFEPIIKSVKITTLMNELISLYLNDDTALKTLKCNSVIIQVLIELAEYHSIQNSVKINSNKTFDKVKKTIKYIQENYDKKITLDMLSEYVHIDKYALCHDFKKATSQTVVQNINNYRCQKAISFLEKGYSVTEVSIMCGFENPSFFSKTFKKYIGVLPSKYHLHTKGLSH